MLEPRLPTRLTWGLSARSGLRPGRARMVYARERRAASGSFRRACERVWSRLPRDLEKSRIAPYGGVRDCEVSSRPCRSARLCTIDDTEVATVLGTDSVRSSGIP